MSMGFGELGGHSDIEHVRGCSDLEHVKMHPEDELGLKDKKFNIKLLNVTFPGRIYTIARGDGYVRTTSIENIGCTPKISGMLEDIDTHETISINGRADLHIRSKLNNSKRSIETLELIVWDLSKADWGVDNYSKYVLSVSDVAAQKLISCFEKDDLFNRGAYDVDD